MKKAELVFIPAPGMGHLVSTVEIAKLLVERDERLSITVLVVKSPFDNKINSFIESYSAINRIRFVHLPLVPLDPEAKSAIMINVAVESQKPNIREAVARLVESQKEPDSPKLAGLVVDFFCSSMIDIANEFGLPTYMFFTTGAAALGMMLHLQVVFDKRNEDISPFLDPEVKFAVSTFVNPVPSPVLPSVLSVKDGARGLLHHARRFRDMKGIMVNTFSELESHALSFPTAGTPKVYPVGPIINLKKDIPKASDEAKKFNDIMNWLDDQPSSSVVFLCFGSMGSFSEDQVKEIASALEKSGFRFLWALRKAPPKGVYGPPTDYEDFNEVLPVGFLERTASIGKVIGWAPQVAVLAHPAVGGFVSHVGWNSTLESLWHGVPIAAWPMYAEQQGNAFQLVKELGLAVEIKIDYRTDSPAEKPEILSADEVEKGIRKLMEVDSKIRKKTKEMSEESKKALMEGGSSLSFMDSFISDVLDNMP